jgi:hypothetical protein
MPATVKTSWLADFLGDLGKTDQERRPNDRLRIPIVRR